MWGLMAMSDGSGEHARSTCPECGTRVARTESTGAYHFYYCEDCSHGWPES